jgi:oligopeptide/dipeptide ABC transporter ATP-binding protein
VTGIVQPPGRIACGSIRLAGRRVDDLPEAELRRIRGRHVGTIFQDPLASLDPLFTIGDQLVETVRTHRPLSLREARQRALQWLVDVGIHPAADRFHHHPHQLSGGMRQRAVIALALCGEPRLVIADEPTTALDVSLQAQIVALVRRLCRERGVAVMLITHDMGVIAETADRVAVMYAGRIVETGATAEVVKAPQHPYTRALLGCIPEIGPRRVRLPQIEGSMPRLDQIVSGCPFHPRCPEALDRCRSEAPVLLSRGGSLVSCFVQERCRPDGGSP